MVLLLELMHANDSWWLIVEKVDDINNGQGKELKYVPLECNNDGTVGSFRNARR